MAESKYWYAIVDSFGEVYRHHGTLSEVVEWFYARGNSGPATVFIIEHYEPPGTLR